MIRYWLTPEPDERSDEKITDINALYHQAPELAAKGEVVLSTDEMTGVQALERKHPGLPLAPGKVERREFEYIRHGTLSFIVNFAVATGQCRLSKLLRVLSELLRGFSKLLRKTYKQCRSEWLDKQKEHLWRDARLASLGAFSNGRKPLFESVSRFPFAIVQCCPSPPFEDRLVAR